MVQVFLFENSVSSCQSGKRFQALLLQYISFHVPKLYKLWKICVSYPEKLQFLAYPHAVQSIRETASFFYPNN